jgi:glycosidase
VAEVWDNASQFLQECGFSGTMNYHAFAYPLKGFVIDGRLSAHDFGRELLLRTNDYPHAMKFCLQNLIDGHDTDRVASMVVNRSDLPYRQPDRFDYDVSERVSPRWYDQYQVRKPTSEERRIQRLAALVQMTAVGPPMLYYGTEAGMWGGDDPCDRMPMVWDDLEYAPQQADPRGRPRESDPVAFDRELHAYYRSLLMLRQAEPALRRGGMALGNSDDAAQWCSYRRVLGEDEVWIGVNRGDQPYVWKLPAQDPSASGRVALTSGGDAVQVESGEGGPQLVVPPTSGVVWKP